MDACIYVIEFDQGTVKVGYTKHPDKRIRAHRSQAAQFRINVTRQWISDPHGEAALNERLLADWCALSAETVNGSEWFTGLSFDEVRDRAVGLVGDRPAGVVRIPKDRMLITFPEAAEALGLPSEQGFQSLVARGEIPVVNLSKYSRRIHVDDLRAYAETGGLTVT